MSLSISQNFSFDDLIRATNVSRETANSFRCYGDTLVKWNKAINLVSKDSLKDMWWRHFLDSAQLAKFITPRKDSTGKNPTNLKIVDFGSGGGFPSLIFSMMKLGSIVGIESDLKKCVFLREVSRETYLDYRVINSRVESVDPFPVDFITARAFASLDSIFTYAKPFLDVSRETKKTYLILPKGKTADIELTEAEKKWSIDCEQFDSVTDSEASVLKIFVHDKK